MVERSAAGKNRPAEFFRSLLRGLLRRMRRAPRLCAGVGFGQAERGEKFPKARIVADGIGQRLEEQIVDKIGADRSRVQHRDRLRATVLEHQAKLLLSDNRPSGLVVSGDPGELGSLPFGEVFGVLPQRVAAALQLGGLAVNADLAQHVPHAPPDDIEGLGCPAPRAVESSLAAMIGGAAMKKAPLRGAFLWMVRN